MRPPSAPPMVHLIVLHEDDLSAGADTLLALLRAPTVRDEPVAEEPEDEGWLCQPEVTPPNDPMAPGDSR